MLCARTTGTISETRHLGSPLAADSATGGYDITGSVLAQADDTALSRENSGLSMATLLATTTTTRSSSDKSAALIVCSKSRCSPLIRAPDLIYPMLLAQRDIMRACGMVLPEYDNRPRAVYTDEEISEMFNPTVRHRLSPDPQPLHTLIHAVYVPLFCTSEEDATF